MLVVEAIQEMTLSCWGIEGMRALPTVHRTIYQFLVAIVFLVYFGCSGNPGVATALSFREDCLSHNIANLEVKQINGRWQIIEGSKRLFDFAGNAAQAHEALRIIRRFGFTKTCYISRPRAAMTYLKAGELVPNGSSDGLDCVAFDHSSVAVRQEGPRWLIHSGQKRLLMFPNEQQARNAQNAIEYYRLNRKCFVGRPNPSFTFWLASSGGLGSFWTTARLVILVASLTTVIIAGAIVWHKKKHGGDEGPKEHLESVDDEKDIPIERRESMESKVEVALAAKLLKLFPPTDTQFLSIPMAGAAFSLDDLDFLDDDGGLTAEELRARMARKSQFARILNLIPKDSIIYDFHDRLLWNEYQFVLKNAILADSVLTDAEKQAYREAHDFLTDEEEENGQTIRVYSTELKEYYKYKEVYEELQRTYSNEKITAEVSQDPDEKVEWQSNREPELRQLKEQAMNDWINLGNKDKIEKYQATVTQLGGKEPRPLVISYSNDLRACKEVDLITNDLVGTYSTFYSPSDIFDPQSPWPVINITKAEIAKLIEDAPPELQQWATQDIGDIESLTVEYAKVVVMRPWFKPAFFESRYWKLPANSLPISDGMIPRTGKIPAFVTNMIVARKITVERLKTVANGAVGAPKPVLEKMKFMTPALRQVNQEWKVTSGSEVKRTKKKAPKPHRLATLAVPGVPRVSQPTAVRTMISGTTIKRPPVVVPARHRRRFLTAAIPPKKRRVKEEVALNGVAVLAYVCRRVPKSPQPDEKFFKQADSDV